LASPKPRLGGTARRSRGQRYVRDKALAGAALPAIRRGVRREAERAITQLERGLSDFGVRDASA
jgi:hypothetical protein